MKEEKNHVCPVGLSGSLDNRLRRWLQNPQKILAPFVKEGMSVMDIGCGPGFFSIELAKLVGKNGKVIAADLQEEMLQRIKQKIIGTELEKIIQLHKTEKDKINLLEKVDFILVFYMLHEVPNKENFLKELKSLLKTGGKIFLVEPPVHVNKKDFNKEMETAKAAGLNAETGINFSIGRFAILTND